MGIAKAIVMDTNAFTAFKNHHKHAVKVVDYAKTILMTPVVLGELLGGFAAGTKEAINTLELNEFLTFSKVKSVEINAKTASHYAKIYLQLRRAGTPIPTNDMWIAAFAKQHNVGVFTYDQHFEKIKGLHLIRKKEDIQQP